MAVSTLQQHAVGRAPTPAWRSVAVAIGVGLLLWIGARATALPVTVTVDGASERIFTHRRTVGALLTDLGVSDGATSGGLVRTEPAPNVRLRRNASVRVQTARPVRVLADGRDLSTTAWGATVQEVLDEAGVQVDRYDRVLLDGEPVAIDRTLPARSFSDVPTTYRYGLPWSAMHSEPLQLRVYRAVPVKLYDGALAGSLPMTIRTTAETVGEALSDADVTIFLGDHVRPSLGSAISTDMEIAIERSTPLSLQADGQMLRTRTQGATVADALAELKMAVSGLDEVTPPLDAPLSDNVAIQIVRVREEIEVEEDVAPFETIFRAEATLPIDTQQVIEPGAEGITRWRYRVRYEDGQQMSRTLEDNWIAQEPSQRIIGYGQQITPKQFTTASGEQITYWRMIRMSATSYSAGTAGVAPDHPWYGRTRSGDVMRKGIVAVDPRMIPLRTRVYVPGYGVGDALDTGSAIRSRRIDLGYDDDNLVLWNRWVDVYLLWPPPPAGEITWVLPNWPPPP